MINANEGRMIMIIQTADIRFEKEYYTRTESQNPAKVQEYAMSIEHGNFPPILITHEKILLDGWHRWMAHKECKLEQIEVEIFDTTGLDIHTIRRKAARMNFRHGLPQTDKELKKMIRDEYHAKLDTLDQKGRSELKRDMAADYGRSERYVREATSRIDKDLKVELRETAFNLWLACYSQEEIAEAIGYSQYAISEFIKNLQVIGNGADAENYKLAENQGLVTQTDLMEFDDDQEEDSNSLGTYTLDKRLLIKANHLDETYKPPIYNIWKQQEKSQQVSHFGNSEVTWLDNLLYLYTNPFDIVIDPFAGGGSTIDLCKTRLRRYFVSDRKPIETRSDIRTHDITTGVLAPPTWKDVKLIYLDPPYWKQAEKQYSEDPQDLGNMEYTTFTDTLSGLIKKYAEKLKRSRTDQAFIALIMQPTQWKAPDKRFTDHVGDMLRAIDLPVNMRYSVPYESQQCTAQMVEWAKANKQTLVLTREIIVWEVR
jgi:biotin operon repressor